MSTISFVLCIGVRGPIQPGKYAVRGHQVEVTYAALANIGLPIPLELPRNLSTIFIVSWDDPHGRDAARLASSTFERLLPINTAIATINELLLAFKMVRAGHLDGVGLRVVGTGDSLFHFATVDGMHVGGLNVGLKTSARDDPSLRGEAEPHIGTETLPVARRYIRCFQLLEHGLYTEAFVIAFSILDDIVQQMLHRLLEERGMPSSTERDELLRGIKESRLRIYLGPLLKLICGKTLADLWPAGEKALKWLNKQRNAIAHSGGTATASQAAVGIFGCMRILRALHEERLVEAEFPVDVFRHAKVTAAWTEGPPEWVPSGKEAEEMSFKC
jgi:hypothetical protein